MCITYLCACSDCVLDYIIIYFDVENITLIKTKST